MEPTHANVDVALAITKFTHAIVEASLTIMDLLTLYSNCVEEGRVRSMERRVSKKERD